MQGAKCIKRKSNILSQIGTKITYSYYYWIIGLIGLFPLQFSLWIGLLVARYVYFDEKISYSRLYTLYTLRKLDSQDILPM